MDIVHNSFDFSGDWKREELPFREVRENEALKDRKGAKGAWDVRVSKWYLKEFRDEREWFSMTEWVEEPGDRGRAVAGF